MATKNPRLSQKYPKEMEELDCLIEHFRSAVAISDASMARPGTLPERLLNQIMERLERARKEFDALMFFTVCFGMLKSGKSTLVNLLAGHEEASPTRFGQDTTLRPCLVLAGEKDEIISFHMKDSVKSDESGEMEKKCFNAVIDYLRGVMSHDDLAMEHHVVTRSIAFSNDNIVTALCSKEGFGSEPLITVIRLANGSELLQSEIALIDVPGLDSDQMKPEIARYIELLERCDLLLFIQSTVSAINHEAAEMLRGLVKRSKSSPVWLIQNRFEAQPWRKKEVVESQDSQLAMVARQNLAKALAIPAKTIFSKQVNLGKAYDARFRESSISDVHTSDAILKDSGFSALEDELSKKINEERLDIQLSNCLSGLNHAVVWSREKLTELEKWIQTEKEGLFRFRSEFDHLKEQFSRLSARVLIPQAENDIGNYQESKRLLVKKKADRWVADVRARLDAWRAEIRDEPSGDEFNQEMERRVRELFEHGPLTVFSLQADFGSALAEIFRRAIDRNESFQGLLSESREVMQKNGAAPLEEHYEDWKMEGPLFLEVSPKLPNRAEGGRHFWFFFRKKIALDSVETKIDACFSNLEEAIGRYVKRLEGEEIDDWFRRYRDEQVSEYFRHQIYNRSEAKETEAETEKSKLESLGRVCPSIRKALDRIEDFTAAFKSSYNLN